MVKQERKWIVKKNMKVQFEEYFKDDNFKNLLMALKNKYVSYGKCSGTIEITPKSVQEAIKLSGFLSKNIKQGKKYKIKIEDIQKSLDESKFEGTMVEDLIFYFFPDIKTKKQKTIEQLELVNKTFLYYKKRYQNSSIESLFEEDDIEKTKKIKYLITHSNKTIDIILHSLSLLPRFNNGVQTLSIFAMQTAKDPHFYDLDTKESNMLMQLISLLLGKEDVKTRKEKQELLEEVGILVDEVSNFVITYNLEGDILLDVYQKKKTPLILNLSNIEKLDNVKAKKNMVLIVENPSFISKVVNQDISYSVIVTSGNSNLVTYHLLEKLKNSNFYFSGDFDPEGLLIAQNFKKKISNLQFLNYNKETYEEGLSKKKLSTSRLKKLEHIKEKDLLEIKELLLKTHYASYQEAFYDKIIEKMEEKQNKKN